MEESKTALKARAIKIWSPQAVIKGEPHIWFDRQSSRPITCLFFFTLKLFLLQVRGKRVYLLYDSDSKKVMISCHIGLNYRSSATNAIAPFGMPLI